MGFGSLTCSRVIKGNDGKHKRPLAQRNVAWLELSSQACNA